MTFAISVAMCDTASINIARSGHLSILRVSIRQIKAARSLLGWWQEDLAKAAGVSIPTIKRLEAADGDLGGRPETGVKIIAALEKAGIVFDDDGLNIRLNPLKAKGKRK